jgi:hypothetical protein
MFLFYTIFISHSYGRKTKVIDFIWIVAQQVWEILVHFKNKHMKDEASCINISNEMHLY